MLPWNRHFHWIPFGTSQISRSFSIFKTAPNYAKYHQIYPYPYFTPRNFSYPKRPDSELCCPSCPFRAENGRSWSERRKTRAANRWIGRENWSWTTMSGTFCFFDKFRGKMFDGICTVYYIMTLYDNIIKSCLFCLGWYTWEEGYWVAAFRWCIVKGMGMSSSSPHSCPHVPSV